jgi:hypothetical protein
MAKHEVQKKEDSSSKMSYKMGSYQKTRFASVTKDATSHEDWIAGFSSVTENTSSLEELREEFATIIEGISNLDYWSTYEVEDSNLYLLCVTVMHLDVGGWDTSLTKREC